MEKLMVENLLEREPTGGGESQSRGSGAGSSVPVVPDPSAQADTEPPAVPVPVVTPSPISVQCRREETIGSSTRNRERAYAKGGLEVVQKGVLRRVLRGQLSLLRIPVMPNATVSRAWQFYNPSLSQQNVKCQKTDILLLPCNYRYKTLTLCMLVTFGSRRQTFNELDKNDGFTARSDK
eukprot:1553301-Amphidinium_carterae.3